VDQHDLVQAGELEYPGDVAAPGRRSGSPPPDERRVCPLIDRGKGSFVVPVTHRDGRRLWVAASFNEVQDADTGWRMAVGSMRDITV
jgi:hypothetical protein